MNILEELTLRIKRLEREQKTQDKDMDKLKALEAEISKLEAQLQHIDDFKLSTTKPTKFKRENVEEITRLQRELEEMEEEYDITDFNEQRYFDEISLLQAELDDINLESDKTASS